MYAFILSNVSHCCIAFSKKLHQKGINSCYVDETEQLIYVCGEDTALVDKFLDHECQAQLARLDISRTAVTSAVVVSLDDLDEQFDLFVDKMRR